MSNEIWFNHFSTASIQAVGALIKKLSVTVYDRYGRKFIARLLSGPPNSIWFSARSETMTIVKVSSLKDPEENLEEFFV